MFILTNETLFQCFSFIIPPPPPFSLPVDSRHPVFANVVTVTNDLKALLTLAESERKLFLTKIGQLKEEVRSSCFWCLLLCLFSAVYLDIKMKCPHLFAL